MKKNISKREMALRIGEFCAMLTWADRESWRLAKGNKDGSTMVADLCEILEGKTADIICEEVGEMSVNQWANYLEILLNHSVKEK